MTEQLWLDQHGTGPPRSQRYTPVHNGGRLYGKPPHGCGLWTSTYSEENGWLRWLCTESPHWLKDVTGAWLLHPAPGARVWHIDRYEDLERLMARYSGPLPGWAAALPWHRDLTVIDFEAMAADGWAGLHLTDDGQWATRLSAPYTMYGWDCESTLWLRWCFTAVEELNLERLLHDAGVHHSGG